jgi:hypothetical protein
MTVKINEEFIYVDEKSLDTKERISLGKKILKLFLKMSRPAPSRFQIFYGKDGDILLRPMTSVPAREAWIYENPKVIDKIKQGLADVKEGRTKKVGDLDKFLEEL